MPAYLVEIPRIKRVEGVDSLTVFAADVAGARQAAAGQFDGDANALWNSLATVTEIVVGTELSNAGDGWTAYCRVRGAAGQTAGFDPFIVEADGNDRNPARGRLGTPRKHLNGSLNSGGSATYAVDDILTASGGTFTRAATFRVTAVSTGVITTIELVDPGEYTVLPETLTANPVTGGGGSNATVNLTQFDENSYEAIMAQVVTDLNGSPDISGASVDFSSGGSGTRLLTVATGSGGDDLGDATVEFEYRQNGTAFDPLVGTITSGGSATDVLSVAIPNPIAPPRTQRFQARVAG